MAPHVCIIGAGVSGLRSTAVLLEHGIKVTIIEARDRVGGRVAQSNDMGPLPVDIGANWVHSTGHNPIIDLADETGTSLHLWRENTLMVDPKGNLVGHDDANLALKTVWTILEKALKHSKASSGTIDPSESLYDFFVRESSSMVDTGAISKDEQALVLSMSEMWGAYVGARVQRQSLKYFFLEDCIGGDDCFIPSNYKKIMAKVSAPALEKASIRFNTVMKSIDTDPTNSGRVLVETTDDHREVFDAVLVTTPLGWLKQHKAAIKPMTARMSQAIDAVGLGNLEKVLIEFPSAYWQDPNAEEEEQISFVHWLAPEYAPKTNPSACRLECVCFSAFPSEFKRNILLFYTYGDCTRHITSMVKGKAGEERAELLREYFEPYYSRLPNYNPEKHTPTRFLATEWSNDEFAGYSCYCNFQTDIADAAGDVLAMRHGIPEKHIYFAGEHTAPFDGLGTVAGAYESGEHVARRIAEDLGAAKDPRD